MDGQAEVALKNYDRQSLEACLAINNEWRGDRGQPRVGSPPGEVATGYGRQPNVPSMGVFEDDDYKGDMAMSCEVGERYLGRGPLRFEILSKAFLIILPFCIEKAPPYGIATLSSRLGSAGQTWHQ